MAMLAGPAGTSTIRYSPRSPELVERRRPSAVSTLTIALRRYSPVAGSSTRPVTMPSPAARCSPDRAGLDPAGLAEPFAAARARRTTTPPASDTISRPVLTSSLRSASRDVIFPTIGRDLTCSKPAAGATI